MTGYFCILLAASCLAVSAAPPSQQRTYASQAAHLQQGPPLEYYIEQPGIDNYYRQAEQNQVAVNNNNEQASRLESLEPDSEVELVPGVQQPQQPPQQNPVAPNIPGLIPGQRVFIVHMPVPGYSPGSIGGYQPVYIVAAGPQGNNRYPGYQNAVILDPSGQGAVSPLGYGNRGYVPQLLGTPIQNPYNLIYQHPGIPNNVGALQGGGDQGAIGFPHGLGFRPQPANLQGPVAQIPNPKANGAPAQLQQQAENNKEVEQKPSHRRSPASKSKEAYARTN